MVHVVPGSQPPSWSQNEVEVLIDRKSSPYIAAPKKFPALARKCSATPVLGCHQPGRLGRAFYGSFPRTLSRVALSVCLRQPHLTMSPRWRSGQSLRHLPCCELRATSQLAGVCPAGSQSPAAQNALQFAIVILTISAAGMRRVCDGARAPTSTSCTRGGIHGTTGGIRPAPIPA